MEEKIFKLTPSLFYISLSDFEHTTAFLNTNLLLIISILGVIITPTNAGMVYEITNKISLKMKFDSIIQKMI